MENRGQDEMREPTLEELGLHRHCLNCISKRCNVSVEPGVSCPHIYCPFKCGAYFHQCKADDHSLLCPNVKTDCLNSELGCQAMMRRALCVNHLMQCPAHVVMCGQSMGLDDYETHFCNSHDHKCEPVLGEWRDQQIALQEAAAEGQTQTTGSKVKEENGENATKKEETDGSEEDPKTSRSYNRLHTVPWQLTEADEGEQGDEDDVDPPLSPPPVSPTPVSPTPVSPSTVTPSPENSIHLSLLPFGILQDIGLLLDRETLHELALTSHLFRDVSASLLRKKGLVETRWKKVDNKWMEDGKIWRYIPKHLTPESKES